MPKLPRVSLGSLDQSAKCHGVDLADVIEPVQSFFY